MRVNVKLTFPFFPFISWNRNSLFSILSCSGVKWFVSHKNTQSHTEMWNGELTAATGCCCRGECSLLLTISIIYHQYLPEAQRHPKKGGKSQRNPTRVSASHCRPNPYVQPFSFHCPGAARTAQFFPQAQLSHNAPLCALVYVMTMSAHSNQGWTMFEWASQAKKDCGVHRLRKRGKKHGVCWTLFIVPPLFVLFSPR